MCLVLHFLAGKFVRRRKNLQNAKMANCHTKGDSEGKIKFSIFVLDG